MLTLILYCLTIISSFFLGFAATARLEFFGSSDIGILFLSMTSASVVIGIVMGKCLASLPEREVKFSMILIPIVCLALPIAALASDIYLTAYPEQILAVLVKYLFGAVYIVIGIVPGLILNVLYTVLKGVSEDASIGGVIIGLMIVPAIEGILVGNSIVEKFNPYIGSGADMHIEDSDGNIHEVFIHR